MVRDVPMMDRYLPRHGAVLRATRFSSSCYPSESLVWGQYGFRANVSQSGSRGPIEHCICESWADG
ncbi:hypothetical protein Hanom_Chr11g00995471 [Helianthus anomalus]